MEQKRGTTAPKLSDFNFDLASLRRYEIALKNGTTIRTDGSADDQARALEMMAQIQRLGVIAPEGRPLHSATAKPARPEPLTRAVDKWLANCAGKNGGRTVDTKVYHIKDFLARMFPLVKSAGLWLAQHAKVELNKSRALAENSTAGRHESADIEVNAIGRRSQANCQAARAGAAASGCGPS